MLVATGTSSDRRLMTPPPPPPLAFARALAGRALAQTGHATSIGISAYHLNLDQSYNLTYMRQAKQHVAPKDKWGRWAGINSTTEGRETSGPEILSPCGTAALNERRSGDPLLIGWRCSSPQFIRRWVVGRIALCHGPPPRN